MPGHGRLPPMRTGASGPRGVPGQAGYSVRWRTDVGVRAARRPGTSATRLAKANAASAMATTERAGTVGCGTAEMPTLGTPKGATPFPRGSCWHPGNGPRDLGLVSSGPETWRLSA